RKKAEGSGKKAEGSGKKAERSGKEAVSKKRAGEKLDEESVKRQKLEDDAEKEELKLCSEIVPKDDEAVNVESLATKYPIVIWKTQILAEDKMYYEIIRADGIGSTRNTQEALSINENKSKVLTSRKKPQVSSSIGSSSQNDAITTLTKQVEALGKHIYAMQKQVHFIQESCETCGGPHHYSECQATGGFTQGDVYAATGNYNAGERPQVSLPSNTISNPREQINLITTRGGLTTIEPSIPPPVPPTPREEVKKETKTLMDEVDITSPASTAHVPPPGIQPV
ncbi:hypothetical protein Tco_1542454, partial [Tanacetum coccineum]